MITNANLMSSDIISAYRHGTEIPSSYFGVLSRKKYNSEMQCINGLECGKEIGAIIYIWLLMSTYTLYAFLCTNVL